MGVTKSAGFNRRSYTKMPVQTKVVQKEVVRTKVVLRLVVETKVVQKGVLRTKVVQKGVVKKGCCVNRVLLINMD